MSGMFFETIERIDAGKRVKEREFDMAILPRVKKLIEKYDIKYDPANPVMNDDAMADRLFAAALDFAVDTGLWVLDTEKVAHYSRYEIMRALDNVHTPILFGQGKDQVLMQPRRPGSSVRPLIIAGAAGSSMTEGEIYVKHMMNFALEPVVDMLSNGNPAEIEGREIRPFSPLEVHGAIQEVGWIREAIRRSGRPGMPMFVAPGCAASAPPAIAIINDEWGVRKGDFLYASILTEMKTDYDRLDRAIVALENGVHVACLVAPMIGGWAGPPAGAAIVGTAEVLLACAAYNATIAVYHPVHMSLKNGATTHRQTLWMQSISGQAISRNTHFPMGQNVFLDARAGTDEIFYEAAANAITAISSGQHCGPGPSGITGGDDVDMITGLEARLMGEVARAVTGMPCNEANRIVQACLQKYEPTLGNPPRGKRMQELYDVARLKPLDIWLDRYEAIKQDLKEMGVPFRY